MEIEAQMAEDKEREAQRVTKAEEAVTGKKEVTRRPMTTGAVRRIATQGAVRRPVTPRMGRGF